MARRIVYLDHSVLSALAKDPSSPLLKDLTEFVEADKVLFPYSWTHHYEAELDSRLEDAIHRVGARLSRGIRFRAYAQIVAEQARRAYSNFLGQEQDETHWSDAYEHDPRGQISERWLHRMFGARVTTHPVGRDQRRANKELFADSLAAERKTRRSPVSYDAAKERRAQEAVQFYFLNPQRRALAGDWTDLNVAMLPFSAQVADAAFGLRVPQRTPAEAIAGMKSMFDFFASEHCCHIPFIDLESSILASLEFDERSRPYAPGDFYDVETWAVYLPYVDIAVADQQMHEVLSRRGLAARFGCSVFPHTQESLQGLISEIDGAPSS